MWWFQCWKQWLLSQTQHLFNVLHWHCWNIYDSHAGGWEWEVRRLWLTLKPKIQRINSFTRLLVTLSENKRKWINNFWMQKIYVRNVLKKASFKSALHLLKAFISKQVRKSCEKEGCQHPRKMLELLIFIAFVRYTTLSSDWKKIIASRKICPFRLTVHLRSVLRV